MFTFNNIRDELYNVDKDVGVFRFKNIRDELYKVNTLVKSPGYIMNLFRPATLYNELSFDLFTFTSNANNNLHKNDLDYFKDMISKKYHTIRMVHIFELNCLVKVLSRNGFKIDGMNVDYQKKRLYFESFETVIKCIYEIYKQLIILIPELRYGVNKYIEDFGFVSMNYTAIVALIES